MFYEIVLGIMFYGFIGSTVLTAINNAATDSRIRRKGFGIDKSKAKFIEKLSYFIQDYAFLIVPFYNIKKGIFDNFFKTTPAKYEDDRISKLRQRGLLTEVKEQEKKKKQEEAKKTQTQDNTQEEQRVPALVNTQTQAQTQRQPLPARIDTQTQTQSQVQTQTQTSVVAPQPELSDEQKLQMIKGRLKQRIAEYQKAEEEMLLPYTNRKLMYDRILNDQKTIEYLEARIARNAQMAALKVAKNYAENIQSQSNGNTQTRTIK